MLSNQKSSRFYSVKGIAFTAIALALLMSVTAFASGNSRFAFIDSATEFFGLQSSIASVTTAPVNSTQTAPVSVSSSFANLSVGMPSVNQASGVVSLPVTVGDTTGLGVISFDMNVDFDPTVIQPTVTPFTQSGTLSGTMVVNANATFPGHLIISAFQGVPIAGPGTLIILNFNIVGTAGQSSTVVFADYTDPSTIFHAGMQFNDGDPAALPIVNGNVNIPAATATNTNTPTPSATNTNTPTDTPTPTNTATNTNTPTPSNTATATATATNTPVCAQIDIQDQDVLNGQTNVVVSVTTSDTTSLSPPAFSADFHITFDPSVLTLAAGPNYGVTLGTVTSANSSTLNVNLQGGNTLLISVFSDTQMSGAGTLVDITFPVVTGPPGTFSPINFTPFVNHPLGFLYNEGNPTACVMNGSVTIRGQMSGNIVYRPVSAVQPRPIPNVTLTSAGGLPVPAPVLSDVLGNYVITGFGPFGYTVTPSRSAASAPNTHGSSINSFDAALVAQHVVNLIVLNADQKYVANVTNNLQLTSFDSAQMALWAVSLPGTSPIDLTGDWQFAPSVRTYASVTNQINENYVGYLMGDVSGNWCDPTTSIPGVCTGTGTVVGELRGVNGPARPIAVSAAKMETPAGSDVTIPVNVQGAANKGIIAYQFDLHYNPAVIQPTANAVTLGGTVSDQMSIAVNSTIPGLLKVAVYGPYAISDSGVLMNFHFTAVGGPFDVSPLTFENFIFNDGGYKMNIADGQVRLSAPVSNTTGDDR